MRKVRYVNGTSHDDVFTDGMNQLLVKRSAADLDKYDYEFQAMERNRKHAKQSGYFEPFVRLLLWNS